MNLAEIGSRIKSERKRSGFSQEKIAEMINVSAHYIYEIERGTKAMSLETLMNISTALNLSTDYILFGNAKTSAASLTEQLSEISSERRERAENAFLALLPYIK